MLTHRITRGWSNGGVPITKSVDVTGGAEINVDVSVGASTTVTGVEFALDTSRVQSLFAVSDQSVQVIAGSSTFALGANAPFLWTTNSGALSDTNGASVSSIASLTVHNLTGTDATVQVRALYTP